MSLLRRGGAAGSATTTAGPAAVLAVVRVRVTAPLAVWTALMCHSGRERLKAWRLLGFRARQVLLSFVGDCE